MAESFVVFFLTSSPRHILSWKKLKTQPWGLEKATMAGG